jgi:hypothetical protein
MVTSNYVAKHVIGTRNCVVFKPSLENNIVSLSIGEISAVQCPSPHNELHCSNSSRMPYVAISHVWANGPREHNRGGIASMPNQVARGINQPIDTKQNILD